MANLSYASGDVSIYADNENVINAIKSLLGTLRKGYSQNMDVSESDWFECNCSPDINKTKADLVLTEDDDWYDKVQKCETLAHLHRTFKLGVTNTWSGTGRGSMSASLGNFGSWVTFEDLEEDEKKFLEEFEWRILFEFDDEDECVNMHYQSLEEIFHEAGEPIYTLSSTTLVEEDLAEDEDEDEDE